MLSKKKVAVYTPVQLRPASRARQPFRLAPEASVRVAMELQRDRDRDGDSISTGMAVALAVCGRLARNVAGTCGIQLY